MARPDCPRCGSDLVVAAPSGAPSEWVLELRAGTVPAGAVGGGFVHWLCRSCGHQWDPEAFPDRWVPGPGDPLPDPDSILADVGVRTQPSGEIATIEETDTSPGSALRRAREDGGVTLSDASKGTRIWERHLHALESDASLEEFPAPAYARFFLREYAEFLRLDPAPLLRQFDARHPTVEEPPLELLPDDRRRTKVLAGVMALISAAAVIVIGFMPADTRPDATPSFAPVTGGARVHDSGHGPFVPVAPERPGVRAVLFLSQPSWVEAVADGRVVESATLPAGERVAYRGRRDLQLTLGNGGGVRLRVNDDPIATGSPGDVVRFDFSWRKGRLDIARA